MSDDSAVTLSQAASQPYPDPIPGIMPFGSISTFAGASGVGKTAMYASWVRRWLDGRDICGHRTQRLREIGLLVGDRRWASHRQWLEAAGVHDDEVKVYSLRDDASFPWNDLRIAPKVGDVFQKALDKLSLNPGGLLITDPMPLWIPGKVNDYKDVAVGLGVMDKILKPRDLTNLGIFHQAKQIADKSQQYLRPQDKILGSAAQIGFSDTAMYLMSPQDLDTPYYGFGWVPHNAEHSTFNFVRDAWGLFVPYVAPEDTDSIETIHSLVPDSPAGLSTNQILSQAPTLARTTVFNCLKRLIQDGRVIQLRRGVYRRAKTA